MSHTNGTPVPAASAAPRASPSAPVSVMIFTLNEEQNLPLCLDSLGFSDDVIVVDSFSTDRTEAICRERGVRFFQNPFGGFGTQRNWAMDNTSPRHDWILVLDADERVPPEMARELAQRLASPPPDVGAYRLRRRFHLWGRWLEHSSLYPTWVVRLVHRSRCRYVNRGHAETQEVEGVVAELDADLIDENQKGILEWFERQTRYARKDAEFEIGEEARPARLGDAISLDPLARRDGPQAAWSPPRPGARACVLRLQLRAARRLPRRGRRPDVLHDARALPADGEHPQVRPEEARGRCPVKASVLVVGGAGYIGSHMVKRLAREGYAVTTLDNLSLGHRDAVLDGSFVHGDLLDRDALARLLGGRRFDLAMHFAASASVGESVADPRKYYTNNVVGALNLVNAMLDAGVTRFIFSSTSASYGVPGEVPITEDHPQRPINPYGNTKLVIERALADYGAAYGLASVALRYFNAAGCDRDGDLRERHDPESHLIPLVLREAARVLAGGAREATTLTVFGDDYPTADGTCVRDYIHVEDLSSAHLLAAERVLGEGPGGLEAFNLGNGEGYSVLQVIAAARQVTGVETSSTTRGRGARAIRRCWSPRRRRRTRCSDGGPRSRGSRRSSRPRGAR